MSLKCADQRTSIQLDHNTHLKTVQTPTTYESFSPQLMSMLKQKVHVNHTIPKNPGCGKQKQEDCEFKAIVRPHFRKDPKKEENAHKLRFPETLQNIETNTSDLASHRFRKLLTNKFFIIDLREKNDVYRHQPKTCRSIFEFTSKFCLLEFYDYRAYGFN